MNVVTCRNVFLWLLGRNASEVLLESRTDIHAVLEDFGAVKGKERGTPAYEVNWEYFRIGKQKILSV